MCVATNFAVAKILTVNSFSHSYRFSWFVVPTRDPTFLPCRVLRKARIGIYVLVMELFNPDGTVQEARKTCVVAGKL